jgi:hypothetical protein
LGEYNFEKKCICKNNEHITIALSTIQYHRIPKVKKLITLTSTIEQQKYIMPVDSNLPQVVANNKIGKNAFHFLIQFIN